MWIWGYLSGWVLIMVVAIWACTWLADWVTHLGYNIGFLVESIALLIIFALAILWTYTVDLHK